MTVWWYKFRVGDCFEVKEDYILHAYAQQFSTVYTYLTVGDRFIVEGIYGASIKINIWGRPCWINEIYTPEEVAIALSPL